MHGNSDDDVTLCVIEVVVASPDADHLKPGFPESTDHLRTGGPRKYYVPALLVFRGTETSTGIGLPSFLATSTYPAIASSQVDPPLFTGGVGPAGAVRAEVASRSGLAERAPAIGVAPDPLLLVPIPDMPSPFSRSYMVRTDSWYEIRLPSMTHVCDLQGIEPCGPSARAALPPGQCFAHQVEGELRCRGDARRGRVSADSGCSLPIVPESGKMPVLPPLYRPFRTIGIALQASISPKQKMNRSRIVWGIVLSAIGTNPRDS